MPDPETEHSKMIFTLQRNETAWIDKLVIGGPAGKAELSHYQHAAGDTRGSG